MAVARRRTRSKPRNQLSAAARGYDHTHRKLRAILIAAWTPGDPCARCGQPMWGPPRKIHLGHNPSRTGYEGLQHERCNEQDGALRLAAMRRMAAQQVTVPRSRAW
jgi:hypothetical protein